MISVEGLTVSFGSTIALNGASAACGAGAIVAVVGPNGAGKSTLLRSIALAPINAATFGTTSDADTATDLEVPAPAIHGARVSGRIRLDRATLERWSFDSVVAWCPDSNVGFLDLTPLENVDLLLLALGVSGDERKDRLVIARQMLDLESAADRPLGDLSLGMRRRTDIVLSVLRRSAVYLFDEPYSGLDAGWIQAFAELIVGLATAGRTVVVASHAIDLLLSNSDTLWEIDRGMVTGVRSGNRGSFSPDDLSQPETRRHSVGTLPWL